MPLAARWAIRGAKLVGWNALPMAQREACLCSFSQLISYLCVMITRACVHHHAANKHNF